MPTAIPAARQKLLARIAGAARRFRKRGDPLSAAAFATQYYRGVAEDDLSAYPADELAAAALAHLRFAAVRKRGRPLVRVYNTDATRNRSSSAHTVVELTAEDMPFLVDSVSIVLNRAGAGMHMVVHPVLHVRRDRRGRLLALAQEGDAGDDFAAESWQHIEIDRIVDPARLRELENSIRESLEDVRLAVGDWQLLRQRALDIAGQIEQRSPPMTPQDAREIGALLTWMADNYFTFLGYREYRLRRGRGVDVLEAIPESGLGILRPRRGERVEATTLKGESRAYARNAEPLTITKANSLSTVHRATYLDYIGIKTFDRAGRVTGEQRFLGLFTSSVYNRSPKDIPLLRHKIDRVVAHFGLDPASHDGKAVMHVLDTYPRDELFQASTAELIRIVRSVVNLYERQRVRVLLRRDAFGRFYVIMIYVPRDRYSTQVRLKVEAVIREHLHSTAIESQVQLSDSTLARVHMIVRLPADADQRIDAGKLEADIAAAIHTWDDRLREALSERFGEAELPALIARFGGAFPAGYQEETAAGVALGDVTQLNELLQDTDRIVMRLLPGGGISVHLRLFRSAAPITLSRALPILENMGFTVLSERPYRIAVKGRREVWLQDFEMQRRDGLPCDPAKVGERFTDCFLAVWTERAENDGFNRLVVTAGLTWRQAMTLRAYCRYILQSGVAFSQAYMEQVLASHPDIATTLWSIFATQFDPELKQVRRTHQSARLQAALTQSLEGVTGLDEDRILRRFAGAIDATLRTNYFQTDPGDPPAASRASKSYLSFKLDSRRIAELPQPRPAFEIFVYSPRVEGVHLRMGHVARGGIRWSDRREDFRTEVLGLMKAQNVKNTVIVPVGAKGGFVPKRLPANASREDAQREGVECYRTFIRGLLDLTDNIVGERVVPPPQVVRRDGDDAYLVVAADKGTASFSDIANRIAAEYNFWLGDAFASGGSAGYDHKKMGITARGAWECVKRHFRELGVDTQSQEFSVAGIGDMSGDVFGNGLLQSPHMRLLAAFNHQHIFLDPAPDAQRSFAERKRLFALPRSTWEDYDRKLISKGGGVFPRNAKQLRLSAQAQALLGVKRETMTPTELIRAVLCMPVDLLWNGGIGTYVKAGTENHAEVGDRSNDAVRVNGGELRCKVVGEGGNLGFSQRGRIEYALNGGRLNTDFVDNSAGVDCSDHEVNIKILLNAAPPRAALTPARRNRLLVEMTDEIAVLVLRDNYLQSQALSMLESRAAQDLLEHAHTIRSLELTGQLDRALEYLPTAEEIEERHKARRGLTRPELSILLSYAKMGLYSRLIDSDVPEDPFLRHELERYFPTQMQKRCGSYLRRHRLRREIIATATTNSMVNRMGASFARRAQEDTGADAASVARAYAIARETFAMRASWADIEALDTKIDARMQYEMMFETTRLLRFATYWLIHRHRDDLDIEQQVRRLKSGLTHLGGVLPRLLSGTDRSVFQQRHNYYRAAQVPEALSSRIASFAALRSGPDLVDITEHTRLPIDGVATIYFELGAALSLDWLREQVETLAVEGHWHAIARSTLRDNIYNLQRTLCLQVLAAARKQKPAFALEAWLTRNRAHVDHVRQTIADMRSLPGLDFATLSVALQAVRRIAQ